MGECQEWIPMVLRWSKHFPPREPWRARSHAVEPGNNGPPLNDGHCLGDTDPLSQASVMNREVIQSETLFQSMQLSAT